MNYVRFAKFLYLWQDNRNKYITTCDCAPFVTCGCWSFKLWRGLLPEVTEYWVSWRFEIYFMRLWLSFARRRLHRSGNVHTRLMYGCCGTKESVYGAH